MIDWALDHLPGNSPEKLRPVLDSNVSGPKLADLLLQLQISVVAVLCQRVIAALENPLLNDDLTTRWADSDAQQTQRVLFDNQLLTESQLGELTQRHQVAAEVIYAHQDWQAAAEFSNRVTSTAPELAWAWDVLGYCYERAGKRDAAIQAYIHGMRCSIFTDQTVRMRTHGFTGEGQKFSASRLLAMGFQGDDQTAREYLALMKLGSADDRREKVQRFFTERALNAPADLAHALWVRAGWDVGAEPMTAFAELLEQVAKAAGASGRSAVAELAKTHRACFRSRYGI